MKKILKWAGIITGVVIIAGGIFIIIERNKVHDYAGRLSPDGSKIVFYSYREGSGHIYLMDPDGSNQQSINYASTGGNDIEPYWSPDGSKISFTSQRGGAGLFMMNPDGSDLKVIVEHKEGYVHFGSWGLDGQHVYFNGSFEAGGADDIYRIDIDGTNLQKLTNATTELEFDKPRIALTGEPIIYITGINAEGMNAIFTIDIDGGSLTQITDFEDNFREAAPSPDGEDLVFTSDKDGSLNVYMMNIESGGIKQMTDSNVREYFPAYSPDCGHIYFSARSRAGGEVLRMNSDGSVIENITKNTRYN